MGPYLAPRIDTFKDSRLPHGRPESISLVEGGRDISTAGRVSGNPNLHSGVAAPSKPAAENAHRGGSNWPPASPPSVYGNSSNPGVARRDTP